MDPRDTSIAYDELASHWAGEDFNRRNGIEQHERALRFLRSHRRAIDIGCGSSGRIVDLLLARFDRVEGLDIAPRMIELAEQRHPGVTFHQTDVCAWEPPHRYDFVSAWDSVWHVPLDAQEAMLRKLCSALEPSGVLLTTTGGTEGPATPRTPSSVSRCTTPPSGSRGFWRCCTRRAAGAGTSSSTSGRKSTSWSSRNETPKVEATQIGSFQCHAVCGSMRTTRKPTVVLAGGAGFLPSHRRRRGIGTMDSSCTTF